MKHAAWPLLMLVACANATGGAVVSVPMNVQGMAQTAQPFTTAAGWQVHLTLAKIALGPFYFNVSPPPTDALRGGTFILEATQQVVVDVLNDASTQLSPAADGITGHAVAAEIDLFAPDQTASDADANLLGNNVGLVTGTATRDGNTVAFSGPIAIDASLATPQTPLEALARVNGAVVDFTLTGVHQQLALTVNAAPWFDSTDFSTLTPGAGTQPATWTEHSTFAQQLIDGVRQQSGVYNFQLTQAP